MAGKIRGKSHEAYYARYKSSKTWEQNRLRKLKRALKRNPGNEEQIRKAMANVSYRRKTPTTPYWTATKRRTAQLFKEFSGKVPSVALDFKGTAGEDYWKEMHSVKEGFLIKDKHRQQGSMFALGVRARTV